MNFSSGEHYVLGADFGSDSVRVVILDAYNGASIAQAVSYYPRWKEGLYCDPKNNQFRQHPLDYLESLTTSIKEALNKLKGASFDASKYVAFVLTQLDQHLFLQIKKVPSSSFKRIFRRSRRNVHIMERSYLSSGAEEINTLCRTWGGIDYITFSGGVYSSEWFGQKFYIQFENPM